MKASELLIEATKPYQNPPLPGSEEFKKSAESIVKFINVGVQNFNNKLIALEKNNPTSFAQTIKNPEFLENFKQSVKNYVKQKTAGYLTNDDLSLIDSLFGTFNPNAIDTSTLKAKLKAQRADKTSMASTRSKFSQYAQKNRALNADIFSEDENDDAQDIVPKSTTSKPLGNTQFNPSTGFTINQEKLKIISNQLTDRWYKNRTTAYTNPAAWQEVSGGDIQTVSSGNPVQSLVAPAARQIQNILQVNPQSQDFWRSLALALGDSKKNSLITNIIKTYYKP